MARTPRLTRRPLRAILLALVTITPIGAGCRESPAPPPPKTVAVEPLAQAREAMSRQDHGAAVTHLREALARNPDDLEAHYRLAVSTSHLDQVEEASREFEWVVTHGQAGTSEVQIARQWLASRAGGGATGSAATEEASSRPDLASVAGRAIGPDGIKSRLQLVLKGVPGSPVQDEYHVIRTDPQGNYRFVDVVPGEYMLTDTVDRAPAWRLRVLLVRGERRTLDLSPTNHASMRDDFPGAQP